MHWRIAIDCFLVGNGGAFNQKAGMIPFKSIDNDEPGLGQSALLRAALLVIDYIETNGPIGLTPSKAVKRYFVQWAAEAFAWPHHTAPELYAMNKVLNEQDFLPLVVLHDVLLSAKLARHYKGTMALTKRAKDLKSEPAELWRLLANHLLLEIDHARYTRYGDGVIGNWDIFLNVINVQSQTSVTEEKLCSVLFGGSEEDFKRHEYRVAAAFYIHVLRPLCWVGLMDEIRTGTGFARKEIFIKTPLWPVALALETDAILDSSTRH